jgi:glycosyltransferase involved in cell wall biosynthesis
MPKVSIILPTYKKPVILKETLDCLAKQTLGSKNMEIIVVDDEPYSVVKKIQT